MGRTPIYKTDEERINARRKKQKEYYNRIKESKRELLSLKSLRRYYTKKVNQGNDNPKIAKHTRRLDEIIAKINELNTTTSETLNED